VPAPAGDAVVDHVALWRGINVGTAKRVGMADLRAVAAGLGGVAPATVLASGNLVAGLAPDRAADAGPELRAAVLAATGVDAAVLVLTGDAVRAIAASNPLRADDRPAARLSVAVAEVPGALAGTAPPAVDLGDERMVVTGDAVYQWLPDGVTGSRVPAAWWRSLPTTVTARNDATLQKIVALLDARAESTP
jgi:uncharacterized protein (DUF1697 family)